ncbi:MAG: dihydrolipoamide succinyltransferase, partial [Acetobacteraceae bacterium]|nr:dihydrolipoamide succinyltransferase [Acetobacteraceae bacterium]
MATEIVVPPLGESVSSATVARWIKKAGDPVAADEPLVELETDKVTVEVNAPSAGTLESILAQEGAEVAPGAVLGTIAAGAPSARPAPQPAAAPAASAAAAAAP